MDLFVKDTSIGLWANMVGSHTHSILIDSARLLHGITLTLTLSKLRIEWNTQPLLWPALVLKRVNLSTACAIHCRAGVLACA